jgi:hypothetical protein
MSIDFEEAGENWRVVGKLMRTAGGLGAAPIWGLHDWN